MWWTSFGAMVSHSPKFTLLLSNAVTPQTARPKCLCLLQPIISSLRHYLSVSSHSSTLGDLIFCHVFLIFTFMRLFSIAPFLSPPIYMFLVLMGVWWVDSELLNRVHVPRTKKCSERRRARGVLYGDGRGNTTPDAIFNFCLTFKLMS